MTVAESGPLLAEIYEFCQRREFICWHQWQPADLVFWNNRCFLHIADYSRRDDPAYICHMHRTTIAGNTPY